MEPKRDAKDLTQEQEKAYNNLIQTGAELVIARAKLDRAHTLYNLARSEFHSLDQDLENARLEWQRANGSDR